MQAQFSSNLGCVWERDFLWVGSCMTSFDQRDVPHCRFTENVAIAVTPTTTTVITNHYNSNKSTNTTTKTSRNSLCTSSLRYAPPVLWQPSTEPLCADTLFHQDEPSATLACSWFIIGSTWESSRNRFAFLRAREPQQSHDDVASYASTFPATLLLSSSTIATVADYISLLLVLLPASRAHAGVQTQLVQHISSISIAVCMFSI